MTNSREFDPEWVSAPGETIADILEERRISSAEFALRIGHSVEQVDDLLKGRAAISMSLARRLQEVLGASLEFWMSRDFQYREDIIRLRAREKEWVGGLPVRDMVRFGWLALVGDAWDDVAACLRFFNVPSIPAWRERYARLNEMVAFRTSPSVESRPAAVVAWLRQGEIEAERIACGLWDPERFRQSLPGIRPLTRRKDPARFLPELQQLCAESGVAVVVVRAPEGCRASGATRFLSPEKALLHLSFRYLTDDHFWFTFFHEAGHLLLHGVKGFFLEGANSELTAEETEANEFAAFTLIPPKFQQELMNLRGDWRRVVRFAVRIGISPGTVVGQMQHFKRIRPNQLNTLKRRFHWED